jgi:hypothetical protein
MTPTETVCVGGSFFMLNGKGRVIDYRADEEKAMGVENPRA